MYGYSAIFLLLLIKGDNFNVFLLASIADVALQNGCAVKEKNLLLWEVLLSKETAVRRQILSYLEKDSSPLGEGVYLQGY